LEVGIPGRFAEGVDTLERLVAHRPVAEAAVHMIRMAVVVRSLRRRIVGIRRLGCRSILLVGRTSHTGPVARPAGLDAGFAVGHLWARMELVPVGTRKLLG
jgi:hypothetical protein